jgi:hypothetical protein
MNRTYEKTNEVAQTLIEELEAAGYYASFVASQMLMKGEQCCVLVGKVDQDVSRSEIAALDMGLDLINLELCVAGDWDTVAIPMQGM